MAAFLNRWGPQQDNALRSNATPFLTSGYTYALLVAENVYMIRLQEPGEFHLLVIGTEPADEDNNVSCKVSDQVPEETAAAARLMTLREWHELDQKLEKCLCPLDLEVWDYFTQAIRIELLFRLTGILPKQQKALKVSDGYIIGEYKRLRKGETKPLAQEVPVFFQTRAQGFEVSLVIQEQRHDAGRLKVNEFQEFCNIEPVRVKTKAKNPIYTFSMTGAMAGALEKADKLFESSQDIHEIALRVYVVIHQVLDAMEPIGA